MKEREMQLLLLLLPLFLPAAGFPLSKILQFRAPDSDSAGILQGTHVSAVEAFGSRKAGEDSGRQETDHNKFRKVQIHVQGIGYEVRLLGDQTVSSTEFKISGIRVCYDILKSHKVDIASGIPGIIGIADPEEAEEVVMDLGIVRIRCCQDLAQGGQSCHLFAGCILAADVGNGNVPGCIHDLFDAAVGDILHAVRIILKTGYPCSFLGPGQFYSIGFLQFLSVAPGFHGDGDGISVFKAGGRRGLGVQYVAVISIVGDICLSVGFCPVKGNLQVFEGVIRNNLFQTLYRNRLQELFRIQEDIISVQDFLGFLL